MDIFAHGLWAGAVMVALATKPLPASLWVWAVGLAILPDLGHMVPVTGWALTQLTSAQWWQYATALPGQEPSMPHAVYLLAHHLHCILHSAVVAATVSALVWVWRGAFWWPLLGWWSHIVIDVFTHSAEFFPSPVFYPLTYWGFDGVAWNQPMFQTINYLALVLVWGGLLGHRYRRRTSA
jgi:hypothetical protein